MLEAYKDPERALLIVKATGVVRAQDIEDCAPKLKSLVAETPPLGLLCDWAELEGWDEEAESIRFFVRLELRSDFERIAILGDSGWDHEVNRLMEVTGAQVQRFPPPGREAALVWLESGTES